MEYVIRKCKEKDLIELVELCGKHSEFEKSAYQATGKAFFLKKAIFSDHPRLFCFVIECDKKLVGYFSYTFDYSTWDAQTFLYLDCLYLEPEVRGLRIGERVFGKLKEIATLNDCVSIQWQTPIFNEGAIKFYTRMGGTGRNKIRFFIPIPFADQEWVSV